MPPKENLTKGGYVGAATMVQQPSAALAAAGGAGEFLHEEYQYLKAIKHIIEEGVHMEDRTLYMFLFREKKTWCLVFCMFLMGFL